MLQKTFIRPIALFLIIMYPVTILASDCTKSKLKGKVEAARSHNSIVWGVAGVGSGVLLGLIGTGVITGVAAIPNPTPKSLPEDPEIDIDCFAKGYGRRAKGRNVLSALGGGAVGTLIAAIVISSLN
ncbi:MAG: hypothetical protein GF401_05745 [Chitinivibrionales bacterium]|nr:hypothetical protein [Chitinivibrionales bacterium]